MEPCDCGPFLGAVRCAVLVCSVRHVTVVQLALVKLDTKCRAVCYAPDGRTIAAGLGGQPGRACCHLYLCVFVSRSRSFMALHFAAGEVRHRREGAMVLVSATDLSTLHEAQVLAFLCVCRLKWALGCRTPATL